MSETTDDFDDFADDDDFDDEEQVADEQTEENVTEEGAKAREQGEPTDVEGEEKIDEEEQVAEEEPVVLHTEDFISGPYLSEGCTLPENIVEFDHSYGYDCKQFYNLCLADERTIIFASGNLIHFFDIYERTLWFRRTAGGGGIGHIVKNPVLPHIAVGEKGDNPLLVIYDWPSMEIVSVLRDGTTHGYSHLGYSPDGSLLCSQGMHPDYMLTIWNWAASRITLRRKSYNQEVSNVMFSPFVPGQLSSSGAGHIKFWKMAQTFTGLKLIGELGRFGKTEMSDILGLLPLPDEKVISGSKWGNMLLWEEGLIKVEVLRQNRERCHTAPITQLLFDVDDGELMTVALDGAVRVWFFDSIDMADPPEDDRVMELEPASEYCISGDDNRECQLVLLVRCHPDEKDCMWLAQDAAGGIWRLRLEAVSAEPEHEQILLCHAGPVVDMAASPCAAYLSTIGVDGRLLFYNYETKRLLCHKSYPTPGACLVWLPVAVENTGTVLAVAFASGIVRLLVASLHERELFGDADGTFLTLIQVTKVHSAPITAMSLSPSGELLVTGAEDSTIFIHIIKGAKEFVSLYAIGYIKVPGPPTYIAWHPRHQHVATVCCRNGHLEEMELPSHIRPPNAVSFELEDVKKKSATFKSVKSQIRRDILLAKIEERKRIKVEAKLVELKKIREDNPGLDFDEDTFLEDSDEEEELEPLHFPEVPNPILFAIYTQRDTLCLSMAGYDAGYLYEYDFKTDGPVSSIMVCEGDDIEMNSHIYYHNGRYLFTGMQDGKVRVNRVNPDDVTDLSDFWLLPMHDNDNGVIRKMCLSFDQRYLFTCGNDCNVFAYLVNPEDEDFIREPVEFEPSRGLPKWAVEDMDKDSVSLEETKIRIDYERRMKIANQRKMMVKKALLTLGQMYNKAVAKNASMAPSQMYPQEEFVIDERITKDLTDKLADEMALTKRKLEFFEEKSWLRLKKVRDFYIDNLDCMTLYLHAIDHHAKVTVFRERLLTDEFFAAKSEVRVRIEEAELRNRHVKREESKETAEPLVRPIAQVPSFLKGINLYSPELKANVKLQKLLARYLGTKYKREMRAFDWLLREKGKPDPEENHPDDVAAINEATNTIGDYKLKMAEDFSVPRHLRATTIKKYLELLEAREALNEVKAGFNAAVKAMRARKLELSERIARQHAELAAIVNKTGERKAKPPHDVPAIMWTDEFPEKRFEMTESFVQSFVAIKPPDKSSQRYERDRSIKREKKREKKSEKKAESAMPAILGKPMEPSFEILLQPGQTELTDLAGPPEYSLLTLPQAMLHTQSVVAPSVADFELASRTDVEDTPWEADGKLAHLQQVLQDQENINADIERSVHEFDADVASLRSRRLEAEGDAKLLETHVLKLNQELIVLKAFETREEYLGTVVSEKTDDDYRMKSSINALYRDVEKRNREIFNLGEREKVITSGFMEVTMDNKFAVHLRKIFKKKYKPPKVEHGDDSESSSSEDSSSSEEDDAASIDSSDIGPIKLDETICPEGCDLDLFNLTFKMRSERHQVEQKIADEKKNIENMKKDIEVALRKKRQMEAALTESKKVLGTFQREKQSKMNQVEAVIIMKLSRFHNFLHEHKLVKLEDTLVFSKTAQTKLLHRTAELDEETFQERRRNTHNHTHMHEIKLESRAMLTKIRMLKEEIVAEKIRKFGSTVDTRFLEEALLRRMIAGMRGTLDEYRRAQEKKAEAMRDELRALRDKLCCVTKSHTERLNMMIVLEQDTLKLRAMLHAQDAMAASAAAAAAAEEAGLVHEHRAHDDTKLLRRMIRSQAEQIRALKHEMRCLRSKSRDDAGGLHVEPPPKEEPPLVTIFRADSEQVTVTDGEITVQQVPPDEPFAELAARVEEMPVSEGKTPDVSELIHGIIQVAMLDRHEVAMQTLVKGDEAIMLDILHNIITKSGSLEVIPDERAEIRKIIEEIVDKLDVGSEGEITTLLIEQMAGERMDKYTVSELVLDVINEAIARVLPSDDRIAFDSISLDDNEISEDNIYDGLL